MPVLKPLHDEAGLVRLIVSTYQAVSGGGLAGVDELDKQARQVVDRAAELTHDGGAVDVPDAREVRPADRVQRAAAGGIDRRRRRVRDRRGAEAPQREPQDPRHPRAARVGHLRAGPGLHRPLAVDQRRVRRPISVERATELLAGAPGVELSDIPTPLEAAGQDPSYVGRIRPTRACPTVAGSRCSSATTTSARVPPSTPSRSPSCSSTEVRARAGCRRCRSARR